MVRGVFQVRPAFAVGGACGAAQPCKFRGLCFRIFVQMPFESSSGVTAIYPGTFDPVTNGHLDLIQRGATIFDQLVVAVAANAEKDPLFPARERADMIESVTFNLKNVHVDVFDGLLVDYARAKNA